MKTILITGAAGFIGYSLLKELSSEKSNRIYAIDNLLKDTDNKSFFKLCESQSNIIRIDNDLSSLDLDISIPEKEIDLVFHLAAFNGTQNFYNRAFDVIINTGLSTVRLLEFLRNKSVGRFVFAGTSESYAGGVNLNITPVPTDENTPLVIDNILNERWSYAASKIYGESAVVSANKQYGIPFTIIRYHNVYGERMGVNHVIPDYLERTRKNLFELYGHDDTRSFLYISDAVADTISVANSKAFVNKIVNIGSNEEIKILELAKTINEILKTDKEIKLYSSPKGSVKRRMPDLTFIDSKLGKRERVSLKTGLSKTIEYYYAI